MPAATPRYLLISDAEQTEAARWRFVLQPLETDGAALEAADCEPAVQGERLELLAVVRGLEALNQPAKVTLLTTSRYVTRGLNYGLSEWRANGWQWEHFGAMLPVKNCDLWQRLDRALEFHEVDCRLLRFDTSELLRRDASLPVESHAPLAGPHFLTRRKNHAATMANTAITSAANTNLAEQASISDPPSANQQKAIVNKRVAIRPKRRQLTSTTRRRWAKLRIGLARKVESAWLRLQQLGTGLIPPPWLDA